MSNLPNFLVVGAAKSGTTSLYHYLRQHPEVYMSPEKEPEYFSFMGGGVNFIGPGGQPMNFGIINNADEYAELFKDVTHEKAIGECSTSYLLLPQAAVNIHRSLPRCRIIIILRHPVDRAFSHYLDHVRSLYEDLSFEEAIQAEPARAADNWRWGYQYIGHSRYYRQVKRYFDLFDPTRIHVCLFDQLQLDLQGLMTDVYRFLGVDHTFRPKVGAVHNPGGQPKRLWLQKFLLESNPIKRLMKPILPLALWGRLRRWLLNANLTKADMAPDTRHRLVELFREDVQTLQELLGRDLSHWLEEGQADSAEDSL